jgi:hypothetical protein
MEVSRSVRLDLWGGGEGERFVEIVDTDDEYE